MVSCVNGGWQRRKQRTRFFSGKEFSSVAAFTNGGEPPPPKDGWDPCWSLPGPSSWSRPTFHDHSPALYVGADPNPSRQTRHPSKGCQSFRDPIT